VRSSSSIKVEAGKFFYFPDDSKKEGELVLWCVRKKRAGGFVVRGLGGGVSSVSKQLKANTSSYLRRIDVEGKKGADLLLKKVKKGGEKGIGL